MVDMRGEVEVEVGIDIEEVHQDMIQTVFVKDTQIADRIQEEMREEDLDLDRMITKEIIDQFKKLNI